MRWLPNVGRMNLPSSIRYCRRVVGRSLVLRFFARDVGRLGLHLDLGTSGGQGISPRSVTTVGMPGQTASKASRPCSEGHIPCTTSFASAQPSCCRRPTPTPRVLERHQAARLVPARSGGVAGCERLMPNYNNPPPGRIWRGTSWCSSLRTVEQMPPITEVPHSARYFPWALVARGVGIDVAVAGSPANWQAICDMLAGRPRSRLFSEDLRCPNGPCGFSYETTTFVGATTRNGLQESAPRAQERAGLPETSMVAFADGAPLSSQKAGQDAFQRHELEVLVPGRSRPAVVVVLAHEQSGRKGWP